MADSTASSAAAASAFESEVSTATWAAMSDYFIPRLPACEAAPESSNARPGRTAAAAAGAFQRHPANVGVDPVVSESVAPFAVGNTRRVPPASSITTSR